MPQRVRKMGLLIVFLVLAGGLAAWGWRVATAQVIEEEYFPQTGHMVSGEFLRTYQSVDDPVLIYGYPITDAFEDPDAQKIIQYFERARFELNLADYSDPPISRTQIGAVLYKPGTPIKLPKNSLACRQFRDNKFQVCFDFRDFFEAHGDIAQFGEPVSNMEYHGDQIYQYFQLARLELRLDKPPLERVAISDLGVLYFEWLKEDPRRRLPNPERKTVQTVIGITARAFTKSGVIASGDEQAIYVIVHDQNFLPVPGVKVDVEITLPSGEILRSIQTLKTDTKGIASVSFKSINSEAFGEAIVRVKARYGSLEDQARTSFRVWW
jgi:hypothetical protein